MKSFNFVKVYCLIRRDSFLKSCILSFDKFLFPFWKTHCFWKLSKAAAERLSQPNYIWARSFLKKARLQNNNLQFSSVWFSFKVFVSCNLFQQNWQNCFHDQFWREFDLIQLRNDTGFKTRKCCRQVGLG